MIVELLVVLSLTISTLINVVVLVVLAKHLHWLWIRKREDSLELANYIADRVKKGITE